MNQQNKRLTASTPADPTPAKRRRGRPRKDENLVQKDQKPHSPPQPPPHPGNLNFNQQHTDNDVTENMVGKPVSGVIEGSFDAGYLLSVRIGNNGTLLRGLVFQPGQFTPVTSANDVAPQAKMLGKLECPNGLVPKTSGTQLEMSPGGKELPLSQDNFTFQPDAHSAPAKVPHTDPLLKTDLGSSFGATTFMPQEIPKLQTAPPFGVPSNPAFGKPPFTGLSQNNNFNTGFGEKYVPFQNHTFAHQFQSVAAFKLGMQSGSVPVPFTNNLPKTNNSDSFLDKTVALDNQSSELPKSNSDVLIEGGETLQQEEHSESLLDNRSMVQLHSDSPFVLSTEPDDDAMKKKPDEMAPKSSEQSLDTQPSCQLQQVSPTENYLKNEFDSGAYLVGNNLPQESSELGFSNSVIAQQNEIMQQQELQASTLIEIPKNDSDQVQNESPNSELKSAELGYDEAAQMPLEKPDLPDDDTHQAIQDIQEEVVKNPERDQSIGNELEVVTDGAQDNDKALQAATEVTTSTDTCPGFNDNTEEGSQHLPFSG